MSKETTQMEICTVTAARRRGKLFVVLAAVTTLLIAALAASPALAIDEDYSLYEESASISTTQAGKHPDFVTKFKVSGDPTLTEVGQAKPWARLRDFSVELPPGLIGNPAAFPECDTATFILQVNLSELLNPNLPRCPRDSQVGTVSPGLAGFFPPGSFYNAPLFNLEAPGGDSDIVARLGFIGFIYPQFIDIRLDPKRENALTATLINIPTIASLTGAYTTIWGVPTDASHDQERHNWIEAAQCANEPAFQPPLCSESRPSGLSPTPFMSNPTSCGPAEVGMASRSYQRDEGAYFSVSPMDDIVDCPQVPFEPNMSLEPTTTAAGASSGLDATLHIPQDGLTDPDGAATSHLKEAVVTLPQGFSLNASAADGLGSCSEEQIGVDRSEQQIAAMQSNGAPVALSFEGQSTAELPQLATAAQAQAALESLPNIGPGDVAVSGRAGGPWTVDFGGALRGHDVAQIGGTHSELQRLAVKGEGGTYTLAFEGDETGPIAIDADAATVQAAFEALPGIEPGEMQVSGGPGAFREGTSRIFRIVFSGPLTATDVPAITTDGSSLAGEGFATIYQLEQGGAPVKTHTVKQGGTLGFDNAAPACPQSSKIATGEIRTPVLPEPLKASFYLAKQQDNPYNSLFAGYLVAKGAGATIKAPARIDVDPNTGQVTTTFTQNPQQPFEDLELHFKGGNRGLLTTPDQCGTYASTYELFPWSGNPPVKDTSEFTLDQNCQPKPFAPGFHAGSETALAGSFTTFTTQVTNETGAPALKSISVDLPEGLSASLAGVAVCSDAALGALPIGPGTGAAQIASPSCPASSQIGTVAAGAGSGSPFYVRTGKAYLAGPYKSAPLSLAVLTPAVAGPFDLGNVLVRVPVTLDRKTARVHAASDQIPTMLSGIPLDLSDVRVLLDRQGFVLNPTSCEPESANGVIGGAGGASANVSDRFQVGECAALGFKPKLALKLKGGTQRGDHPALSAILRPRPGDANLASATVALPKSEFLDQSHIGTVCTRVQFQADQCPKASIYGAVTARTPLLDEALTGNVYLRSSDNKLPDLVMDLRGPASRPLKLEAVGRIDSVNGGIRTSFEFIPDAPVTKVILKMKGGKKGLLQNSRDICAQAFKATAAFSAHNGRSLDAQPEMQARCKKARKAQGKGKHHGKSHG